MMMRALEVGGIPCVYTTEGDDNRNRNTLIPGYIPNPHGFYEGADVSRGDWSSWRGCAVKVIRDNLSTIPSEEYCRIVYMKRDPAEIRRSYVGILSGPYDENIFRFLKNYATRVAEDYRILCKQGHEVVLLDYASVVENPLKAFTSLDWPLDVQRAASVVDPMLYRHRGGAV